MWPQGVAIGRGVGVSGGKVRKKMRSPSIIFPSVSLGAEFIAVKQEGSDEEEAEQEKVYEEVKERRRCLCYGTGLATQVCLSACPHTVEISLPSAELWTQRGEKCPNTTRTHASSKYSEG